MTGKTVDSVTTSYTYDAIDQLLSETRTGYAASYTYDANGNRATRTVNGLLETYVNDAGDKLTSVSWSGGSKTYGYDAAGRTTSITTASGTTSLVYDYESRVTSITYPNASVDTFTYNGLDTRVGKAGAQGSFTFKRDGVDVTDPVLNDGAASYTPGVSERRSGTSKFNVSDYLGTNSRQLDSSQATSATRQYDAFGNLISSTGSPTGPFGFAGGWGYQEDASGLKLLGHRYYDSSTGRFLTRDLAKSGRHWYSYCGNSPNKRVDPKGYYDERVFKAILDGMREGKFPPDTGDKYKTDKAFQEKVHRAIGDDKISGERDNPDLNDNDLKDAIDDALQYVRLSEAAFEVNFGMDWSTAAKWVAIGTGVALIVVAVAATGGAGGFLIAGSAAAAL